MGRIWKLLALFFIAVQLRWQELWRRRRWVLGSFLNKAPPFSLWRLPKLVFIRGVRRLPESFSVKLLRGSVQRKWLLWQSLFQ
jgi:hypothetical protein